MTVINIGKVRPTYRGAFVDTQAYEVLDRVSDSAGFVYEAVNDVPSGTALSNAQYWLKLSVEGPRGQKGDTGNRGPRGEDGTSKDSVLYVKQELKPEQKAVARGNIGGASDEELKSMRTELLNSFNSSLGQYVPKRGNRGALGGFSTTERINQINATSSDCNTCQGNLNVQPGAQGTSWTKIVTLETVGQITLGANWKWAGGEVPTLVASGIVVLCWCGSSGIAAFISPSA